MHAKYAKSSISYNIQKLKAKVKGFATDRHNKK